MDAERRFVVDASVAIKWVVAEQWNDDAVRLLGAATTRLAPDLILLETANALVKRLRRKELTAGEVVSAHTSISDLVIVHPTSHLSTTTLSFAMEHQISVYDATYVALALEEGCRLVTADRRLLNALLPVFPEIMLWVEDVPNTTEA